MVSGGVYIHRVCEWRAQAIFSISGRQVIFPEHAEDGVHGRHILARVPRRAEWIKA